jgi:hypothetical protein
MALGDLADELRGPATSLDQVADEADSSTIRDPVEALSRACSDFGRAWSGSWLGYHSCVYYLNFQSPPPGATFDPDWGFMQMFSNTTKGPWTEYRYEDVIDAIETAAGNPDLGPVRSYGKRARKAFERSRDSVVSVLSTALTVAEDRLLEEELATARGLRLFSQEEIATSQRPKGQISTHDMRAINGGFAAPPHLGLRAHLVELTGPGVQCESLATLAGRAAEHMDRMARTNSRGAVEGGSRIFIGHGHSPAWRELKDFLRERLGLETEEFNRVSPAGISTSGQLDRMLANSTLALLILTPEDEQSDGSMHGRENVIHEAGLFQGRLGFSRAVVVLDEACEEFSNIHGLGQIRFASGNIAGCFEEIRKLLEREGLLLPAST